MTHPNATPADQAPPGPDCCAHCSRRNPTAYLDLRSCTCPAIWMAVIPPPPCRIHGQLQMVTVTCGTATPPPPATSYVATVIT